MNLLSRTLSLLLLAAAGAQAKPIVSVQYKDWSVICDNTRHCEAAGYQTESGDDATQSDPVVLVLRRDAGPGAPLSAMLEVSVNEGGEAGPLTVKAGKVSVGPHPSGQELNKDQLTKLWPALLKAPTAEASDGKRRWIVSLAGLNAALLKMDEVQGRLDTPGALLRKGARPEANVLPPLPAPQLAAAPVGPELKGDDKLVAAVLKALPSGDCPDAPASGRDQTVHRLSGGKLLVLRECYRAAYQSAYEVAIVNDKPPFKRVAGMMPKAVDGSEEQLLNASFSDGVLNEYVKGRGIGDCGSARSWLWTATGFQLYSEEEAPACRGIPGGVMHPVFVAKRVR